MRPLACLSFRGHLLRLYWQPSLSSARTATRQSTVPQSTCKKRLTHWITIINWLRSLSYMLRCLRFCALGMGAAPSAQEYRFGLVTVVTSRCRLNSPLSQKLKIIASNLLTKMQVPRSSLRLWVLFQVIQNLASNCRKPVANLI